MSLALVVAMAPAIASAQVIVPKPGAVKTYKEDGCFDRGADVPSEVLQGAVLAGPNDAPCLKIVTADQKTYYLLPSALKAVPGEPDCRSRPDNNVPTARTMGTRGAAGQCLGR